MGGNEDFYKREEDRKWREKVDHEQVTLMTAVNVLQEQLRDMRSKFKDHDVDLRGEKGRGGLIAEFEKHDDKLTKLYAVIFQDSTGQKGVLHDVDLLMGRRREIDAMRGLRWQAWAGIVVAIIGGVVTLILNIDKLYGFLKEHHAKPVAEHKRVRHQRHVITDSDEEQQ